MKYGLISAITIFYTGCTSLPDHPKEFLECSASHYSDEGRFEAVRYLELDGELAKWSSKPEFYEKPELNWFLNSKNGDLVASVKSNPWDSSAYNYEGNISFRFKWEGNFPVGTRIFLELPQTRVSFEGYPITPNSVWSGIYENWDQFKKAIEGQHTANIVFTSPEKVEIKRDVIDLQIFHTAANRLNRLKQEIDEKVSGFENSCKKETIEYIF